MIKDPIAACKSYADDNEGVPVTFTLDKDLDDHFQYSGSTWDDGAPVAKMFERNDAIPLHVPKGTTLHGVVYTGRASGHQLCEFIYGQAWYRTYAVDDDGGENITVHDVPATQIV